MIVVKVGGSEGIDLGVVCRDVASLVHEGQRLILVHGGSHRTTWCSTEPSRQLVEHGEEHICS